MALPLPNGASLTPPALPKGATLNAPEQGNMYTQGAEDIQYSPEGIPLYTSSYGSAPTGATETARKGLTTAVSLPINIATGAAKPTAGMVQTIGKYFGGGQTGDNMVNTINQIESGTQAQSGNIGGALLKGGSIAGEVAPYVMSPMGAAKSLPETVGGAFSNLASKISYAKEAAAMIPSYAQRIGQGIVGGATLGAASGAMTPEKVGLTPEEFGQAKAKNIGVQSAIGAAGPLVAETGKLLAAGLRKVGGMTTGAGEEALSEAYKAGVEKNPTFMANLKGEVPTSDVLNQAKSALQNIRDKKSAAYQEGIKTTQGNQVFLDFKPITQKLDDTVKSLSFEGVGGVKESKVGAETLGKVKEMTDIVNTWKAKPELHTAGGLDALKQRLDDVYSDSMTDQAKRVLSGLRNQVKQTIVTQDKNYAKTMADYEKSIEIEREIERALSLGQKASVDTALRKLQSLTRNNANTSFSYRKELADLLKREGGQDLMPALSGQALSQFTPRGLVGQLGALGAGYGAYQLDPDLAYTLPLSSPKVMGLGAYGAGRVASKVTPEQLRAAKLLIMQGAGRQGENK